MNDIANEIKELWCEVLKIEECDPDENFFDLGGNSLQIIKILNALDDKYGLDIEIESIYDDLTLKELTNVVLHPRKIDASTA